MNKKLTTLVTRNEAPENTTASSAKH